MRQLQLLHDFDSTAIGRLFDSQTSVELASNSNRTLMDTS